MAIETVPGAGAPISDGAGGAVAQQMQEVLEVEAFLAAIEALAVVSDAQEEKHLLRETLFQIELLAQAVRPRLLRIHAELDALPCLPAGAEATHV